MRKQRWNTARQAIRRGLSRDVADGWQV